MCKNVNKNGFFSKSLNLNVMNDAKVIFLIKQSVKIALKSVEFSKQIFFFSLKK